MRFWRNLLGGLILWTAHFFAVYGVASIWPGTPLAGLLVLAVTILAIGGGIWLSLRSLQQFRAAHDDMNRWASSLALLGYALSGAAIAYQGLPAVLA